MRRANSVGAVLGGVVLPWVLLAVGVILGGCAKPQVDPEAELNCDLLYPAQVKAPPARAGQPRSRTETAAKPPAEARPAERTISLGKSVRGVELAMTVFGDGAGVTLILGGIHGDEPSGADLAQRFLEYLRSHPDAYQGHSVAVLARANPDGLAAGTRVNAHGVDVNRSFPASNWQKNGAARYNGGASAAAEPETKAIMQAVRCLAASRIISVHAISGGRQCNNWDGPAEDLARRMAGRNGYPAKATIGYPTPGSMGTWAGIDQKIPMITLELPEGRSNEECWRDNQQALLEALR
jgi:murein peptide amidase A